MAWDCYPLQQIDMTILFAPILEHSKQNYRLTLSTSAKDTPILDKGSRAKHRLWGGCRCFARGTQHRDSHRHLASPSTADGREWRPPVPTPKCLHSLAQRSLV